MRIFRHLLKYKKKDQSSVPTDNESVLEFSEVQETQVDRTLLTDVQTRTFEVSSSVHLVCLHSREVEKQLTANPESKCGLKLATEQHSDLIPNVYEGGLTVWECSVDLACYLAGCGECLNGRRVLELGCGAGLPGLVAIRCGATSVHFQDYNPEVIEHYTIPNVLLNRPPECTCTCRYFTGDWSHFQQKMHTKGTKYDVILTAETIYKPANYSKLLNIFQDFLSEDGTIYVAAKSNYFGVGGGTQDFMEFVRETLQFRAIVCHTVDAGLPREILKLTRKT
ncbi:histidine protein methyltransferase 1 homolog isoform X2 [Dreissena polymorpha]|uniref:histidine protein methyltransferase 1 homolog isoform X2 n=1 Tax=Dreissena polymorpha TaxID=45954 RepID=UPI00226426D0|nr:histidine protein methyltransferase 1 homolog isoform X2 [Dreissena polymorpha]